MVPPNRDVADRRTVLRASASALAVGALAGCVGNAREAIGAGGETTTRTTTAGDGPTATVAVGPDGKYVFAPETLVVPPGTTVTWVWKSDTHNIAVETKPDGADWTGTEEESGATYDAGHEHSHTFEVKGTYEYVCVPHETIDMKGEIVVSGTVDEPTAREATTETAEETETGKETETGEEAEYATEADLPVKVGPGGRLTFEPGTDRPLAVDPGTTVRFVWESDNHNIAVHDQPDGAEWQGTPGDYGTVYDRGYEYSHTFEVEGTYEFVCIPHETAGMVGTIVVGDPPAETTGQNTTDSATADSLPVKVGPGGGLTFEPAELTVTSGTTVEWVWESDSHNVVVESQPEGANWEGTPGPSSKMYDQGYEYTHTFDVPGTYEFFCQAHKAAGMRGTITVTEE
ncbi:MULTISPECIES: plastocyanin/azurin family copper-binding protein [Halorussus]|uniref:plastocyanin/azurin family copper-binding protein n=1 Tax=Halorussus TaxID=1070314 RepID=UPI0020A1E7AF|nr:plastocyanin/azurin family copper-binding protein [Halorussus vallis]USZ77316.1 plastocyanin/azurin family copper-binding protein [Halorussus vallis]